MSGFRRLRSIWGFYRPSFFLTDRALSRRIDGMTGSQLETAKRDKDAKEDKQLKRFRNRNRNLPNSSGSAVMISQVEDDNT